MLSIRKSLMLAGIGLLAPFCTDAVAQEALSPVPSIVLEKIDPLLMRDADQLATRGVVEGPQRARNDLRVVIDVTIQPGDATFQNSRARNRVAVVTNSVLQRQLAFERAVRATLPQQLQRDVVFIDRLSLQYGVVALLSSRTALIELARRQDVKYVWRDTLNHLNTIEGRALTGSLQAANSGHTGAGVGVAVIDSHFDLLHPELGGSTNLPNGVVSGGQNFSDPGTSIYSNNFNDCYHGTGTASIVRRYAPGCSLYCLTVFPNAFDSVIANSINWCVTNQNGTGGGAPIRVISMSLGGGRYYSAQTSGTMHSACGTALANGIVCYAASGNDGWTNSMGSPAASTNCISVGSVWDANNAAYSPFPPAFCSDSNRQVDERCCYSDTASFLDVYAPSEEVICARCGGGTFALGGTSSACPAAAGLTAQLLHAAPQLAGDMNAMTSLWQTTGATVIGDTSKRRIDLTAAIASVGGGGGGGGGATSLDNGVTQNYSVATGGTIAYTIDVPANATDLTVTITGSGDADLYVKRAAINWPADQGAHDDAEFKSQYIGGSSESVSLSSPAEDTWNVLVHGYSGNPAGTITASWTVDSGGGGGGGNAQWNYVDWVKDTPHRYRNNRVYTETYSVPGAQSVAIHFVRLDTETNYDFLRVYDSSGTLRYTESGYVIANGSGSAFGRTDGWVVIPGDTITIQLTTDHSVRDWGFRTDTAAAYY